MLVKLSSHKTLHNNPWEAEDRASQIFSDFWHVPWFFDLPSHDAQIEK